MPDSPSSSSSCPPSDLIQSLHRQTLAMERLANLLPQLVAVNQALLEALVSRDEEGEEATRYLDGSVIGAEGSARS